MAALSVASSSSMSAIDVFVFDADPGGGGGDCGNGGSRDIGSAGPFALGRDNGAVDFVVVWASCTSRYSPNAVEAGGAASTSVNNSHRGT